jgi:hypothetical protein
MSVWAHSVKSSPFPGVFLALTQDIYPAVTDSDMDYLRLTTISLHNIYNVSILGLNTWTA